MSSQMKEEERIERIIRGLLKLPDNRRCINCNSSGPQYVCTTFWTFVCMNCSGVHREFTHRVKSVSMAKFTAQEVSCLQAGGNERARQIYFKTWDPIRNFCPDGSNLNKLRDFIKHVYVDRKFSGEKSQEKAPIVKPGSRDLYDERHSFERSIPSGKEVFGERRNSFESCSLGDRRWYDKSSRGSKEDLNDRCYLDKHNNAGRKIEDRNLRYGIDQTRSPRYTQPKSRSARFEIVDDRFREDGSGNVRRYEHYRFSKAESKRQSRSPDSQRAGTEPTHPVVCPITDILGDKVVKLRVGDPPEPKEANAENNGESTESADPVKPMNLIDFEDDLQPPALASSQSTQPRASSSSSEKASANVDSTESLLLGMSPAASPTVAADMTSPASVPADSTTAHQENVPPEDSNAGNDQKHSGRNELPEELFTTSYSPFSAAAPGWMEYGMQYHPHRHMMLSAKSRNPFDVCEESPHQVPTPMLPSMLPPQGTPNVLPSPYALAPPLPSTSYGMVVPPGAYVGPQLPNNLLMRGYQEGNNSETGESPFALLNPLHQSSSGGITYTAPHTCSSHSSSNRTNPFSY